MFPLFRWVCRYLSFKLIAGILCSLALACGFSLLWGLYREDTLLLQEYQTQAQQTANLVAASLATHPVEKQTQLLEELMQTQQDIQAARILAGEEVLSAHSRTNEIAANTASQRRLVGQASIPGRATVLEIELSPARLQTHATQRFWIASQQIGVVFLVTLILVALLIRFRVCLPLQRLELASQGLGQGDLECPIAIGGNDELQRVAQILDELRKRLRQKVQQFERQQEQLRFEMQSRREGESAQHHQQQQQAVLARLGFQSLQGLDKESLLELATNDVLEVLRPEACRVYQYDADNSTLTYCGQWSQGSAPAEEDRTLSIDPASLDAPARALVGTDSLIPESEDRSDAFDVVPSRWFGIQTLSGPFGTLEIVPNVAGFSPSDRFFLQCVVNILSGAMARDAAHKEIVQEIKRHASVFAGSLDGLLTIDAQGTILAFNPAAEQLFGYSCTQVVGQNFVELLIPVRRHPAFRNALKHAAAGDESRLIGKRTQTTAVGYGNQEIPVELVLTPLELGRRKLFNVFVRDLTKQRQAEQELEYSLRSQKALNSLLQLSLHPAPLAELLQKALEKILSVACPRLLPRGGILLYTPEIMTVQKGLPEEEMQLLLSQNECGPQQLTALEPNEWVLEAPSTLSLDGTASQTGTRHTVEIPADTVTEVAPVQPWEIKRYCVPIHSEDNQLGALVVYLRQSEIHLEQDIELLSSIAHTLAGLIERKRGELALRQAKDAAEAASRAKSMFLANMSHEVRTPLGAVLGLTEILFDPDLSEEDRQSHLHSIGRNSQHLLDVLNDILDLSKIEAGEMELQLERCSPWEQIENVVASLKMKAKAKQLSLLAQAMGPIPRSIKTDPTRLRQILVNFLSNSIKFTHEGQIVLRATVKSENHCQALGTSAENSSTQSRERLLCFEVVDSGIGVPQECETSLFQPFQQADSSASRSVGGTGLGLSICKRLATAMGGEVGYRRLENGSVFWLCLPLNENESQDLFEPQESSGEFLLGKPKPTQSLSGRVLLVEDTADNQKVLTHHLQKAGLEVALAENGQQAVQLALHGSFDLLLMDMQMPVLDGYEATQQLRQAGCSQPIIALTAHAMLGDRDRCLSVGCNEYLTKPVDPKRLIETLRIHLPHPLPIAVGETMHEPIRSEFVDDNEFMGLVREYAANLPQRVHAIRTAMEDKNLAEVAGLAHQNKGAGGMYGFPQLSEAARRLEESAKAASSDEQLEACLVEFEQIVARIQAGL